MALFHKMIPLTLFLTSILALSTTHKIDTEITVYLYESASPVVCSLRQNPYFTIPFAPTQIYEGNFYMDISTPPIKDTFIRELTGFYKARRSGKHLFSTPAKGGGTIQLGARDNTTHDFVRLISNLVYELSDNYATFDLIKGTYYPIRVKVFSDVHMVPIHVSDPYGVSCEINFQILQVVYDQFVDLGSPNGTLATIPIYYNAGFYTRAFLCPEKPRKEFLRAPLSAFQLIHDGYFDTPEGRLDIPRTNESIIKEIIGHFQPPLDGHFSIAISAGVRAAIQIGPGNEMRAHSYIVNSGWQILDTRFSHLLRANFQRRLLYPFRIVIFGHVSDPHRAILQLDPVGRVVDLFQFSKWGTS